MGYLFYFDSLVICINLLCSVSDFISVDDAGPRYEVLGQHLIWQMVTGLPGPHLRKKLSKKNTIYRIKSLHVCDTNVLSEKNLLKK